MASAKGRKFPPELAFERISALPAKTLPPKIRRGAA
jgi:hypothetical protein